ncbi:NADPH-dependent F420 reductase [bacterium]|nr:NADPH-dependent F420 reductase [bacterium]
MKIGVIGNGNMGGALGKLWSSRGHKIMFGSRNPESVKTMAGISPNINSGSIPDAVRFGEVILLAVPWHGVENVFRLAGPVSGKIIIDCTNPLAENYMSLVVGFDTSGAEEIAKMAPGARVVKAFNTVASGVLARPKFDDVDATALYCGDDAEAKKVVAGLIKELGFEAIDSGPLMNARYLEPMAEMFVQLSFGQNMGFDMAWKLLRRK